MSALAEPHEGEPGSTGYERSGPQQDSTANQAGAASPRLASRGGGWYHQFSAAGWSSLVARRAHNPKVAGSNPAPAIKYGRFSRLLAYAQAADQHVWSVASVFMGRVCGVLLNSRIGQKGGAPGRGRAGTLELCMSRQAAPGRCTGHAPMQRDAVALLNGPWGFFSYSSCWRSARGHPYWRNWSGCPLKESPAGPRLGCQPGAVSP